MRSKKFAPTLLLLASLVFLGAGCGQKAAVTDSELTQTGGTSDDCGNPYYPFKAGLAISYRVTPPESTVGSSDYTIRILTVEGTKATIRSEMADGSTADMTADCSSGSVSLIGSSGLGQELEGMEFKTTVVSSTGTFMPAKLSAGATWENSETIKMEVTGGQAGIGPIITTTSEKSRAVAEEDVVVPAGKFKAMKVEVTRTIKSELTGSSFGFAIPSSTSTSTEWWVKGVGMVKSVTISDGVTSTVEATSIAGK